MAGNIEIKAKLENTGFCITKAKSLSGGNPEIIKQNDTFFNSPQGRLKLRVFSPDKGQLIFYRRENISGPKLSEYYISETEDPDGLLIVLEKAYGIIGSVKKTRQLFWVGRTRIHIDQVDNLGDFIEFELVLSGNEEAEDAEIEALQLMKIFDIKKENLIEGAYLDLLNYKVHKE